MVLYMKPARRLTRKTIRRRRTTDDMLELVKVYCRFANPGKEYCLMMNNIAVALNDAENFHLYFTSAIDMLEDSEFTLKLTLV